MRRINKIDLFREGLHRALLEGLDASTFAHEFDFGDKDLLSLAKEDGIYCPKCKTNEFLDCIDGHIVCLCGWEYE